MRSSSVVLAAVACAASCSAYSQTCYVYADADGGDDASNLMDTFQSCSTDSLIVLPNTTYHIDTVMNITGLKNVGIELQGTIWWGTDVSYWLENSLPIGYQNQSTAWMLGGDQIDFYGNGVGTLNGNGQTWYDYNNNTSNLHGRPHMLTLFGITNSYIHDLNFIQPQMWTVDVVHADNITLENVYVSAISDSDKNTGNTDGSNTLFANDIHYKNWTVSNGDDCIALKANSSNIVLEDITCIAAQDTTGAIAVGSIGQYAGEYSFIENVTVTNLTVDSSQYIIYIKTFTGEQVGYPPNGGGGGLGYASNLVFQNITSLNARRAFTITQCVYFADGGAKGNCDSSLFQISDLVFRGVNGTLQHDFASTFDCSGSAPCTNITVEDVSLYQTSNGDLITTYNCDNVEDTHGFTCS